MWASGIGQFPVRAGSFPVESNPVESIPVESIPVRAVSLYVFYSASDFSRFGGVRANEWCTLHVLDGVLHSFHEVLDAALDGAVHSGLPQRKKVIKISCDHAVFYYVSA